MLTKKNIKDIYPATPMQEGMYFHWQYDPSSLGNFLQLSNELVGEVNVSLFKTGFDEICKRYDVLRTVFVQKGDRLLQVVLKERNMDFFYKDISSLQKEKEKQAFITNYKQADMEKGFHLGRDMLMRAALIRTGRDRYTFTWTLHHILMDGWCLGILIADFFEIYSSYLENRPFQLPAVTPYRVYIEWLEERGKEQTRQYWQRYLQDYRQLVTLPQRNTSPVSTQPYLNRTLTKVLDKETTRRLNHLATQNQVTLNIVLQVLWGILLAKVNHIQDVVFGTVVSGRPSEIPGVETMIGLFIHTVPVRITFDEQMPVNRLLEKMGREAVENESHHYYSLADLQAQWCPGQPLLDHILVFQNYPISEKLNEISGKTQHPHNRLKFVFTHDDTFEQTSYHLNIIVSLAEELTIKFAFNENVYEKIFIEATAGFLFQLIQQVIQSDTQEIGQLTLLTREKREQVLYMFNRTAADYPEDKTLHRWFEEQAARKPDRTALVFENRVLTYGQLNARSNQAAWRLKARGVKADTVVGLMTRRSFEMIIGLFAILKAGGAYLPLDPAYPSKRILYMLRDADVLLVVTQQPVLETLLPGSFSFSSAHRYLILPLDSPAGAGELDPGTHLGPVCGSRRLVYVMYTSGSTGHPKGVMLEHNNLVNLIHFDHTATTIDCSNILQFSTISFDASAHEIFCALLSGGCLTLIHEEARTNIPEFLNILARHRVKTVFLPMSFLKVMLSEESWAQSIPRSLSHIQTAGEPLIIDDTFRRYLKENRVILHDHYGPTETHVATALTLKPHHDLPPVPPIGVPVNNTAVYIMDNYSNPVPVGVPGELYIGGVQVGRGYVNKPELTFDRFIQQVTGPIDRCITKKLLRGVQGGGFLEKSPPGRRRQILYRTGDLARWLPDGNIVFLGRIDQQVKIRGFRIEPGEIETQLTSLEGINIKEAVVVDRLDSSGDKFLCAFLVCGDDTHRDQPFKPLNITLIKNLVSKKLPDYMIPSYFVQLQQMPLTPSGKADRSSLTKYPLPMDNDIDYEPPRNPLETKILRLWSRVLDVEEDKIGINRDFFKIGGHSLKATLLVSKIYKELKVSIPLKKLFQFPTVRGLSRYIDSLEQVEYSAIKMVEKKEYYSLSSTQKRMYVLHHIDIKSTVYNIPGMVTLKPVPGLNRSKLEGIFQVLLHRHSAFRTSFVLINGEVVQRVHEPGTLNFTSQYKEIKTGYSSLEVSQSLSEEMARFIQPFDLSQPPLLRLGIIDMKTSNKYILMIEMHHIVSDLLSMDLLLKEFVTLLEYETGGGREKLAPLPLQYVDYAGWQTGSQQEQVTGKQGAYWLHELESEGGLPVLDLPTDFHRPPVQQFDGDSLDFRTEHLETALLKEIAAGTGTTLYMLLLAFFYILLAKLSGQEDIIIGTPVAGRRHPDLQHVIGMFVNTLALRNYPACHKTFNTFLQEVKHRTIAAFENQDYPFEELVEKVSVERDTSRNPIFDVSFSFDPGTGPHGPGQVNTNSSVQWEHHPLEMPVSRFDLSVNGRENNGCLLFTIDYCTKLFKPETIDRFARFFKRIITQLLENTELQISRPDILAKAEKHQILNDFNDTAAEYPQGKTIHQLFAAQAEQTPDQIALIGQISNTFGAAQVSYGKLNEKANQLAHLLKEKGVGPETIAAIMMERSIAMIIGIFGILKAGSAYLPIDPDYPQERIDYMLKDSSVRVLVTTPKLRVKVKTEVEENAGLPPGLLLQSINIETDFEPAFKPSFSTLTLTSTYQVSPTNLAYVIYTSGSTGKPKGTLIRHASLVNRLHWMQSRYPLDKNDAILQKTTFTFDVSIWELTWWPLAGAKVCMLEPGGEKDPAALVKTIEKHHITVIHFVPPMLNVFLEYLSSTRGKHHLKSLKQVFASGEALTPPQVKRFGEFFYVNNRHLPRLTNLYGPTEATIDVSYFDCPLPGDVDRVPIGKPIYNTQLYILDKGLKLQPVGVTGELCIGGIGLARGYLNLPELTHEKFCVLLPGGTLFTNTFTARHLNGWRCHPLFEKTAPPDPPHKNILLENNKKAPDKKISDKRIDMSYTAYMSYRSHMCYIYRTGDLARWLPDGNIEFLGRTDHQVKIRGFRVETGDIECQLLSYPGIKEVVVAAHKDKQGDKYLCAYIVSDSEPVAAELREFLSLKLPSYMVPAYFARVEHMPLTSNGKVNRKALPLPRVKGEQEYTPPGNEIERKLVRLCQEILPVGNHHISIDDNFFHLGGHSLTLTVMATRIHKQLDVNIPLAVIFKNPSIKGLARFIREAAKEKYLPLQPIEKREYYPLSPAQKRMYILQQMDPGNTIYNVPLMRPLAPGDNLDRRKLEDIIGQLMKRHESFRTSFRMINEQPVQMIHDKIEFEIRYLDSRVTGAISSFIRPFDLSQAPLFRAALVEYLPGQYMLMLDMHHIISDDVSQDILLKDFLSLWQGRQLPLLRLRYKDYVQWLTKEETTRSIKHQGDYWLREFPGDIPLLNLPTDYERPDNLSFRGNTIWFQIDTPLSTGLKQHSLRLGVTSMMFLLAVYKVLLAKYTGQADIIVGIDIAGRQHADLEDIIGFFVNMMPIKTRIQPDESFSQYVRQVKEKTVNAFDNQDYPFEELVSKLDFPRHPGRHPLVDAVFVFQDAAAPGKENEETAAGDPDPTTPELSLPSGAHFDLVAHATDHGHSIRVILEYSTDLFKESTIRELSDIYLGMLGQVVEDPGLTIEAIGTIEQWPAATSMAIRDEEDWGL